MKAFLYPLLFSLMLSAVSTTGMATVTGSFQQQNVNNALVLAKVNTIPEVKKYLKEHTAISPRVIVARQPIPGFNYYLVKVGMGTDDKFQASYSFCITPKNLQIFFLDYQAYTLDPANAVITLEQWRRYRSTQGYLKMHTYKNGKLVLMNGQ